MKPVLIIYTAILLIGKIGYSQQNDSMSQLSVSVEDFTGKTVEWAEIQLVELGTKRDLSKVLSDSGRVPFGVYSLRVNAEGMGGYERLVRVYQDRTFVRVGLSPGPIAGNLNRVLGKVRGTTTGRVVWTKLVPLLSSNSLMDYLTDSNGSFEFMGADTGQYLLVAVEGTTVLATKQVWVNGESEVTIEIP